ncbi:MAG: flagellar biosynthesis protein FlgH [Deltaproteobacteria bacterium]|nr:MAG: flagellar biosynthesis protein FlgH [Deltaproteobacteria bacterium]
MGIKILSLAKVILYLSLLFIGDTTFLSCARKLPPPTERLNTKTKVEKKEADLHQYEGSLWKEGGVLSDLFSDQKARKVGDILTVSIVESSSASNKATTQTGRKSSVSGGIENFFNMEKRFPASHPFFNPFSSVKGGLESNFDGSGETTRSGKINAYLTARVVEILPNGNLRIEGSREVTVNNDRQFITLSGIVRPRDISPENVVLSTYIADAKITYSGVGVINDRQRPGWTVRILDWIWPF